MKTYYYMSARVFLPYYRKAVSVFEKDVNLTFAEVKGRCITDFRKRGAKGEVHPYSAGEFTIDEKTGKVKCKQCFAHVYGLDIGLNFAEDDENLIREYLDENEA